MSGFWLLSYVVLWILVAGMALLLVGTLRQIGMLHLQLQQGQATLEATASTDGQSIPPLESDGPPIGSPVPAWVDYSSDHAAQEPPLQTKTLLMFLSPLCDTCQQVVEPLNALADDSSSGVRPIAVFRSDRPAYEAFLKLFPLHGESLRDSDRTLTMELGVHRSPFGLLYDEQRVLIRKGLVEGEEDLAALLGDSEVSELARMHVFPRVAVVAD
jgi:hypothetical protein